VAHIRSRYSMETTDRPRAKNESDVAENAVRCASFLHPGRPVYVAADSSSTLQAVAGLDNVRAARTTTVGNGTDPIHIDKGDSTLHEPSGFFDTFVDLLVMGNGRCVSYDVGGFGILALLISVDATCSHQHYYKDIRPCRPKRSASKPNSGSGHRVTRHIRKPNSGAYRVTRMHRNEADRNASNDDVTGRATSVESGERTGPG